MLVLSLRYALVSSAPTRGSVGVTLSIGVPSLWPNAISSTCGILSAALLWRNWNHTGSTPSKVKVFFFECCYFIAVMVRYNTLNDFCASVMVHELLPFAKISRTVVVAIKSNSVWTVLTSNSTAKGRGDLSLLEIVPKGCLIYCALNNCQCERFWSLEARHPALANDCNAEVNKHKFARHYFIHYRKRVLMIFDKQQ